MENSLQNQFIQFPTIENLIKLQGFDISYRFTVQVLLLKRLRKLKIIRELLITLSMNGFTK